MLRATLRNLGAHKLRLGLTVLSVVLGVALVAGTLTFTDTLQRTFSELFEDTTNDVVVTKSVAFTDDLNPDAGTNVIPASVLDTVLDVDGVAAAEGAILVDGVVPVDENNDVVGNPFAPRFGTNWSDDENLSPLTLVEGGGPTEAGQVAVDTQTADEASLEVGDTVRLVMPVGEPIEQEVVGIFRFGESGNLAGASLTAWDTATTQDLLLGGQDAYTSIEVQAEDDVSQEVLADRVQAAVGSEFEAKTGEETAAELTQDINEALSFINIFLLVFAIIALVVGTFIIFNTFSMLVAQRTRELALLRAVGARRRQVTRSVLLEALIVGVVGATIGLFVGLALALGIRALFSTLGFLDIPQVGLVVSPSTVIWAYVIGVVVTVAAAYLPARRASRVPPVAAMRDDAIAPPRSLRVRTIVGLVLLAIGLAVGFGSFRSSGGEAAQQVGIAAAVMLLAVLVLAAPLARPLAGIVGAPLRRLFPITGRLATRNATRNSRRTAATASALIIMLTVVTGIGVIATSASASVGESIEDVVKADFTVASQSFTGFSPEVGQEIAQVEGVEVVSPISQAVVQANGESLFTVGVDPATIGDVAAFEFAEGGFEGLADDGVLIDSQQAEDKDWAMGTDIDFQFLDGEQTLTVVGIYEVSGFFSGFAMDRQVMVDNGTADRDFTVFVKAEEGADLPQVRNDIDAIVDQYPTLQVQDQSEFKESVRSQVNQLLFLIYGLLVVAAIIAALGIVNTLLLAVIERTREIGLLRAVGARRKQIKQSITIESLIIAIFGAVVGVALGLLLGWWLQHAVADDGIGTLAIPWAQIVVFFVIAVIVGYLAARWPARRGSRLNVLEAIATE
jgi:putative ABC transport system permease protein